MQMLTGPGISGSLTDAMSKRIIAEIVAPKFRAGDFAGGVDDGVAKMIAVIDGELLPPPAQMFPVFWACIWKARIWTPAAMGRMIQP